MTTDLITRDELRAAIEAGSVTVIDALGGHYWATQHLPGALPLHPSEAAERAADLLPDRTRPVVTYCSNPACPNSGQVANTLTRLGYTNVRTYKEGIEDWTAADLPTESAADLPAESA
ncbi:rhodanese-like domain-containing protein [Streptomyces sp. NBC_01304]|uniref:rhodanese-like domain-containing protein n=1 Tax=Streptomyces sp. NBC_01304 TaxID=2903818 RepID=UPI002E157594|nr:rhodanese-like domain-containing protein [Streptomyces sp. NBC_01304]